MAPLARDFTNDASLQAAINVLKYRKPLVFCVDEAQHMTYSVRTETLKKQFDQLKWFADQISSPILLAGTDDLMNFGLLTGQLGRRVHFTEFRPYRPDDAGLASVLAATKYFLNELPIRSGLDPAKHAEFFFEGCGGAIGMLKPWFERVLHRCLIEGRTTATLEDLENEANELGTLAKLAEENNHGRMKRNALRGNHAALRAALGMSPVKTQTMSAAASAAPTALSTPTWSVVPASGKRRPGQRKLGRDPVGEAAAS